MIQDAKGLQEFAVRFIESGAVMFILDSLEYIEGDGQKMIDSQRRKLLKYTSFIVINEFAIWVHKEPEIIEYFCLHNQFLSMLKVCLFDVDSEVF